MCSVYNCFVFSLGSVNTKRAVQGLFPETKGIYLNYNRSNSRRESYSVELLTRRVCGMFVGFLVRMFKQKLPVCSPLSFPRGEQLYTISKLKTKDEN